MTRYWMWYKFFFYFFTFPSRLSYWYSERHKLRSSFTTRILVYFQPSMRKYLVIIAHRPPIYPIAVDNWVSLSHRIARTLFVRSSKISFIENFIKHLDRITRNRWTEPQATSLSLAIAFSYAMAHSGFSTDRLFQIEISEFKIEWWDLR